MPNSGDGEVVKRITHLEKWLRRVESLILRPTGSGPLHDEVTVTDTATLNLTLTGQNIKGDVIGGGGGGHTIQDEGVPLAAETNLNFAGAGVVATDDPGNSATLVTIAGGAAVADIGSTAETVGGAVDNGVAATASRSDHKHAITNPKIDDLATADDNTDLNSNTTNHGLMIKAVAPAAGLSTVAAIENGETIWKAKALFDTTNPEDVGVADPGTSLIAARRDHVHAGGGGDVATDAIWDAKGDLAVGTGADTAAKLTVGANGTYLKAASGEATGLIWDTPAGAGDVVGPAGASDGNLAVFDGATGKLLKDGGAPGGGSTDVLMVQVFS